MSLVTENKFVLDEFYELITPNKITLFDRIAAERTRFVTIALENIYQEHNASAVLRTCDCFGIQDLHVIEKDNQYQIQRDIALGSGRWVDIHNFNQELNPTKDCIHQLKQRGYQIVATTPHTDAYDVHNLPIDKPLAFFFGTERQGLSDEMMDAADLHVRIPMYGFTESFNVSVCAALCLYELTTRIRETVPNHLLTEDEKIDIYFDWLVNSIDSSVGLIENFYKDKQ